MNLPPPPPQMVYANQIVYISCPGGITANNWYDALLDLQETQEARAAIRDVWAWEQAGCPTPEKQEPEQVVLDARNCTHCGDSFLPIVSRQIFCSSRCRNTHYRPIHRGKCTEIAFCANPECELEFDRTNPKKVYCCEKCSSRAAYLLYKSKKARA